jgi:acyl-coenzyme A synthetase/AMP-(fatty) acid ligase
MGIGPDVNVSWQLPTWTESAVLVGALCRLGAVQNPMLPIYRYREVSFIAQQTGCKLLITPSTWNKFDYGALAEQVAGEVDGMHALVADHWNPDGDPASRAAAAPGAIAGRRPGLDLHTSGTTRAQRRGHTVARGGDWIRRSTSSSRHRARAPFTRRA